MKPLLLLLLMAGCSQERQTIAFRPGYTVVAGEKWWYWNGVWITLPDGMELSDAGGNRFRITWKD